MPDANSSIPLLLCFLFGDYLSKLRALVFEGIRLHLKYLCIYYKWCSGREGHGFNQYDAAGHRKQEERASHVLSSLRPEDGAFVKMWCLFAPNITGRGTVHGHTGVMRLLPVLSTCQAGRRAAGCAGKGGLGHECQLNAGLTWATELAGGLGAVKQSQTNAVPSHMPRPCSFQSWASSSSSACHLVLGLW